VLRLTERLSYRCSSCCTNMA